MKTNKMKVFISAVTIASASLLMANSAHALCYSGQAKVVEVDAYSINGSTYGYIYTVPEHAGVLPSTSNYFLTYNQNVLTQAIAAKQNNASLAFYGDATACPTTGSFRYGGNVVYKYDTN